MKYSSASTAKNWINGYNSAYVAPYAMYNYGDANSCPQSGTTATPAACANGWTQEDINYVTLRTAAGIYPLPQIYSTAGGNAKQWQQLALYGKLRYGYLPTISGPLTQKAAWDQRCAPLSPLPPECAGVNNTSQQAWDQLWKELNAPGSNTAGSMTWSTDIKWK
jgi:hypothetical protein